MMMRIQHKRPDGEIDTYLLKPGRKYHLGRGSTCEIRILDLKLSRKHCCLIYEQDAWQVEDLGSTNGCRLNGEQVVGSVDLTPGATIEAGATSLTVSGFIDPTLEEPGEEPSPLIPQDPMPMTSEAPLAESTLVAPDWEPQADDLLASTGALQPRGGARKPLRQEPAPQPTTPALGIDGTSKTSIAPATAAAYTAPLVQKSGSPESAAPGPLSQEPPITEETRPAPRVKPVTIRVGQIDGLELHPPGVEDASPMDPADAEDLPPTQEPKTEVVSEGPVRPVVIQTGSQDASRASASGERPFFITVLGRRIGPLARNEARDLKARELKGTLTLADLESFPQG